MHILAAVSKDLHRRDDEKGSEERCLNPIRKWQEFLQHPDNKQELFAFLSGKVALTNLSDGKTADMKNM